MKTNTPAAGLESWLEQNIRFVERAAPQDGRHCQILTMRRSFPCRGGQETRAGFKDLRAEFTELRRDLAEEFRAQRAEAAAQVAAIANAIIASRRSEP